MEHIAFGLSIFTESLDDSQDFGQVDHNDIFLRRRVTDPSQEQQLPLASRFDANSDRIYTTVTKAMRVETVLHDEDQDDSSSWVKEFISTFNKVSFAYSHSS